MKILCVFGQHNYGNVARGLSYEYVNFIPALRRLGHDVVHFESFDRSRYRDFVELNRALLQTVVREQPHVVLFVLMHYEVWLDTIEAIRRASGAMLIHWGTDDSWKYEQFTRLIAPAFDLCATTYLSALAKSRKDGLSNFVLTQWAANSEALATPLPAVACRYPVSFVGSAYGNRRKWIDAMRRRGIEVNCFGYGWESGPVAAEDVPRIIRESVISLNFADSGLVFEGLMPHRSRQIKARVFEVPGAGGFLLTESADGLERFFTPDKDITLFQDEAELAQKIEYYLSHPALRDDIAAAGHARTVAEHTYDARFSALLQHVSETADARPPREPVAVTNAAAVAELELAAARHRLGAALRVLRRLLNSIFCLVWRGEKGRRAARKFVFELSWRLAGRHTYTSAGWPGRMYNDQS